MPWRVRTLIAAWLIRGANTCCAQPCRSATRPRRSPSAGKTLPPAGPGSGRARGASESIAVMRRNRVGTGGRRLRDRQQRRERPGQPRQHHADAKQAGIRQDQGQRRPQHPLGQRPLVVLLDPRPGLIDQMHVVHAGRTGRHAGKAGKTAVDVLDHLARRRLRPSPASP